MRQVKFKMSEMYVILCFIILFTKTKYFEKVKNLQIWSKQIMTNIKIKEFKM